MTFETALEILQATVDANPDRALFTGLSDFVALSRLTVAAARAVDEGRRPAAPVLALLRRKCAQGLGVLDLPASPVWHAAHSSIMDAPKAVALEARRSWVALVKAAQ